MIVVDVFIVLYTPCQKSVPFGCKILPLTIFFHLSILLGMLMESVTGHLLKGVVLKREDNSIPPYLVLSTDDFVNLKPSIPWIFFLLTLCRFVIPPKGVKNQLPIRHIHVSFCYITIIFADDTPTLVCSLWSPVCNTLQTRSSINDEFYLEKLNE